MSSPIFQQFRDNLKVRNADDISTAYGNITKRLNKDFWNLDSDLYHRRQLGSYGRQTAIHGVSDLDMAFELPWAEYERYKAYDGNGPSQLLQAIRGSLKARYPSTEIRGDGQVVVIQFDTFTVEVLPVFIDKDSDGYRFPDTNNGGQWLLCKPIKEIDAVNKRNDETNRNYKHACKMIRAWKNYHGVAMSGMLIDTLTYNFFSQNNEYHARSYGSYDTMFVSLFTFLGSIEYQEYWAAPGSGQRVYSSGKFQTKAKKAAAKCKEALDTETENKKISLWREIFGRSFPSTAVQTIKVEASIAVESSRLYTEQFIEDRYPVDIRHELEIDCELTRDGTSSGRLRRLAASFPWLAPGQGLRFHVSSCSALQPFQLFWKVRNVGAEAEQRKELRGQILHDEGRFERRERTTFAGAHFVEAYIVKDGVCIARDIIDVPIAN